MKYISIVIGLIVILVGVYFGYSYYNSTIEKKRLIDIQKDIGIQGYLEGRQVSSGQYECYRIDSHYCFSIDYGIEREMIEEIEQLIGEYRVSITPSDWKSADIYLRYEDAQRWAITITRFDDELILRMW